MNIEWITEPPEMENSGRPGEGRTQRFVAALSERPGHWAKYPRTLAAASSLGAYRSKFPNVEWTVRRREDGRVDIYARWVAS